MLLDQRLYLDSKKQKPVNDINLYLIVNECVIALIIVINNGDHQAHLKALQSLLQL